MGQKGAHTGPLHDFVAWLAVRLCQAERHAKHSTGAEIKEAISALKELAVSVRHGPNKEAEHVAQD